MVEILTSSGILLGLTLACGTVLAAAYVWLSVEEDPRVAEVESMLPGTNCGSCGQPGCHAFAEAIVAGTAEPGLCTVGSPDSIHEIAAFLGVDAGMREKRVARLHCAGGRSSVRQLADYRGLRSCRAAFVVNGGGRACPWGCLGFADCERACTFDAIKMNEEALPVVDVDKCTACNDCVEVCPLDLFTLEPVSARVLVQCSAPLTGEAARAACRVACDACGRCAVDADPGAIEMVRGLPVIREPAGAGRESTLRCPTGAIRWVERQQFEEGAEFAPLSTGASHG